MKQERALGWDTDGMCDDHGRFACQKCAVPETTPSRDDVTLLPCPFCGGEAHKPIINRIEQSVIWCHGCEVEMHNGQDAIPTSDEQWNTRAITTPARDGAVSVQEAREDVTQADRLDAIREVVRAAFYACEDSEDSGDDVIRVPRAQFDELSAALDRIDQLMPDAVQPALPAVLVTLVMEAVAGLAHTARPDAGDEIERVARALCEQHIRRARRWDTEPADLEAKMPAAVDYNWRDHKDDAHAAIAAIAAKQLHDALARLPTSPEATP